MWYNISRMVYYKAVDAELMSLGLKRVNPIQYELGEWVYPREEPQEGQYTPGGLWVAKNKSFIKWLEKYLAEKYERPMLVYSCEIGETLWESVNRVKTDKVKLLELYC